MFKYNRMKRYNLNTMNSDYNYSPAEIAEFVYIDQIDLFMLAIKTGKSGTKMVHYQPEESNMFYVWLKAKQVKEGNIEDFD